MKNVKKCDYMHEPTTTLIKNEHMKLQALLYFIW